MSFVNGSGISVSVSVSPSGPRTPPPPLSASGNSVSGPGAPMKKRYEAAAAAAVDVIDVIDVIDVSSDDDEEEEESVSPRVLFPVSGGGVARRLDFYSSGEWSPIPFATAASASVAREEKEEEKEEEKPVGDCSICYDSLPARSNHVYTLCGHLFCVKCLLRWWDTAITCPICRANIMEADGAAAAAGAGTVSAATMNIVRGWEVEASSESDSDNDFVGDDFVGGAVGGVGGGGGAVGGVGVGDDRGVSITSFNRYLRLDSEWSRTAVGGVHDPEADDNAVGLSQDERDDIRLNREIATNLWARSRFRDTLFSNIEFLGGVFHEFIPKRDWIEIGHDQMGPHQMFEFVMCRTAFYNAPIETNFFGYISSIVVVRVTEGPVGLISVVRGDDDWENSHEYAFIVHVFSPAAPYGRYNFEEGTFETAELLFRFAEIRRMYSITAMERGEA